jgi:hypothetical protein
MRFLLSFVLLLTLCSCGRPGTGKAGAEMPRDSLITEAKMILILADLHTVEALLLIRRNKGEDPPQLAAALFDQLFRKYGVTRQRFDMNLSYYKEDPEKFAKMYDYVVQVLTDRKRRYGQGSE